MKQAGLAALATLLACTGQPVGQTSAFREPTAAVVFSGWTPERPRQANPLPQPYLAVANGRADELRLIDLVTYKPLMSPGAAYPLSVPTLARPSYLAASSLRDAGPDLLAVAGVGAVVDIVSTWEDGSVPGGSGGSRVVVQYDLSAVAGVGAEILSMIATPVPGAPAGSPPVAPAQPGRAWLILGFSGSADGLGGKLVVLEFVRGADGSVELGAPVQVKPLGCPPGSASGAPVGPDPVSLAVSPDLFHLYVATPDVITDITDIATCQPSPPPAREVQGVAEVDMSGGAAAPWAVRGLDARSPTMLVAAAILGERLPGQSGGPPSSPDIFGPPALRVYAALDPSGCGAQRPIDCGIAVIDPALGGLAPDIAPPGAVVPAQPHRAPILVPAVPLTLSVALPAASGPLQCIADNDPCNASTGANQQPLMRLVANGQRWTPAVGAVGASDGKTYLLDLGRSGPAADFSVINDDNTRTAVVSAASLTPLQPDGSLAKAGLGLYRQYPLASAGLTADADGMREAVMVTPGFTRGEAWSLVWQGYLPSLAARSFVLGLASDGSLYLAFQTAMGNRWEVGAYVGDPVLGIHAADVWPEGDLVQFELPADQFGTGGNPCALAEGTKYEATIASILPPDPGLYPGGALKLVMPGGPASDPFSMLCLRDWLDPLVAPGPAGESLLVGSAGSVRASGLVLSGSASGYAGRPPLLSKADVDTGQEATKRFNLAWQDETTLFDPSEALVLARKARRFFYANDRFVPPANADNYPESGGDPLAAGPALGLIAGPICADEPVTGQTAICPPTRMSDLLRDSVVVFSTRSGVSLASRQPAPLSLPSSAIAVDRSQFPDGDLAGSVFYVTYHQNAILVAVPGQTPNISSTLR